MTTLTAAPATALDVLRARQCSASCLLGAETGRCHCRCGGTHHGELLAILTRQADAITIPQPGQDGRPPP